MIRIRIETDNSLLAELQYRLAKLGQGSMPSTAKAMKAGANLICNTWKDFAMGGTLPGIAEPLKRPNGGYARSIHVNKAGAFDYEIASEAKIAELIEKGTLELDMKKTHPFGQRSRVSKKGIPYLIVPFQWGTKEGTARAGPKNIVPKGLLCAMRSKRFKASSVNEGTHTSPNAKGQNVERWTYSWGNRASGFDFAGTVEQKSFADGMTRFEQGEKNGKRYGGYFTFRVISADPKVRKDKWIKPAMPARPVTKAVVQETKGVISAMVDTAIIEDLRL